MVDRHYQETDNHEEDEQMDEVDDDQNPDALGESNIDNTNMPEAVTAEYIEYSAIDYKICGELIDRNKALDEFALS